MEKTLLSHDSKWIDLKRVFENYVMLLEDLRVALSLDRPTEAVMGIPPSSRGSLRSLVGSLGCSLKYRDSRAACLGILGAPP